MLETLAEGQYKLSGNLDMQHTELLAILMDLEKLQNVELDCSGLVSADSVLLAAILTLAKKLASKGGTLRVGHFPHKLVGLAATYGIDSLINEYCHEN